MIEAAIADLVEHGLASMSIDRVAKAAEVNKTSVYRRFGTRDNLVRAALARVLDDVALDADPRAPVGDEIGRIARTVASFVDSRAGRALALAAMDPSMATAIRALAVDRLPGPVEAGVKAGGPRADVVLALVVGPILHRVLLEHQPVDEAWLNAVVAVLRAGLDATTAR